LEDHGEEDAGEAADGVEPEVGDFAGGVGFAEEEKRDDDGLGGDGGPEDSGAFHVLQEKRDDEDAEERGDGGADGVEAWRVRWAKGLLPPQPVAVPLVGH
jgi:hypothetical protein